MLTQPIRVELSYRVREQGRWVDRPFVFDIDAQPLAVLAESAVLGHRLHEFMRIERPGDILRYWWVTVVDFGPEVVEHVRRRMTFIERHQFARDGALLALPFVTLDGCFWAQESQWIDPDIDDLSGGWVHHRQDQNPRPRELDEMLGIVHAAQARLRSSAAGLQQHELALIDTRTHACDWWARTVPIRYRSCVPVAESRIDPGLFELITSLARRKDVNRVSCPFDDRVLWRALVWEQVQRAKAQAVAPSAALFLAGPDSGMAGAVAEEWGGDIHIPYEGAHDADLFVRPDWHEFHRDRALAAGTVRVGLANKAHRYAIVEGDLGEFPRDERVRCGEWTLYRVCVT